MYFDDIIIFSQDESQHLVHIRNVLECLNDAGVKLKRKKCSFLVDEIHYCGYIVKDGTIGRDEQYTESVSKMEPPSNINELNRFLGLVGYSRQFIGDYATVAKPLNDLKKTEFLDGRLNVKHSNA